MLKRKKTKKLLDTTMASETLKKIGAKNPNEKTKVSELIEDFHENGILLAMIFFSIPVAIPLPYPPGFTTIIGTPLIILALQMFMGSKKVKLTKRINEYEINNSTLKMISDKTVPIIQFLEKYTKPRLDFARSVYCEQFVGFICLICSISVAIPLPFTNAIPALGIAIMSLGLMNRDGITIMIGFIISIIGVLIATTAILASWVAIKYIFYSIF